MQRNLHTSCCSYNNSTFSSVTLLSLLLLDFLVNLARANVYVYSGCSQEKSQQGSSFEANLNSFLSSSVSSSAQAAYNSFGLGNGTAVPSEATVYGLYQCRGDLKIADCSKCIQGAVSQIGLVCPYSYGASLQLEGCYVRYEHIDFLGKPDTSLRYKKCGKSVSSDIEFFRRRDDVLTDLKGATGFRVSSSGLVEGFAQCIGDLSAADCSACLAEAVEELKTLCGSAAAADVFLAQCYARYWASGYYDYSSGREVRLVRNNELAGEISYIGEEFPRRDAPETDNDRSVACGLDPSREDGVGKTVAIIVGSVAGLAVIIVLLSLCQKAMAG